MVTAADSDDGDNKLAHCRSALLFRVGFQWPLAKLGVTKLPLT